MNRRLNRSVKEAFDHLPTGVCFFNKNGTLTLCNHQMYRVFFDLTGKDLQSLPELEELLENHAFGNDLETNVFLLDNGHAWRFAREQITTQEGHSYTQVTASDVTELYRKQEELEQENRKLEEDTERIRRLSANIISLIREEETLNMKMRVHDDIGRSVIATRQFLQQRKPMEELDLAAWKNAVLLLKHENELSEEQDAVASLMKAAYNLGIRVSIDGTFPEDAAAKEIILSVIRECMTNAVRHAGAKDLYVCLRCSNRMASVSVTNNGAVPDGKIVEGGGLTSLRILVKKSGGSMKIATVPHFELTVFVPVGREKTE